MTPGSSIPGELARETRLALQERRRHRAKPPGDGLVLEVGGGQRPYAESAVVIDLYAADDYERAGEEALSLSRPLIVADGHSLPFADGAFDYVIAQHVLEHATDPTRFAGELCRVAAAGFVQVPSREAELTFGWSYHPWLIDRDGDTLVFHPKGEQRAQFGELFHQGYKESPALRLWIAAHQSRWLHSIEWRDRISVRVEGDADAEQTAAFDVERTVSVLGDAHAASRLQPLPPRVMAALRCPSCGGALHADGSALRCDGCGRSYPIAGEVPILVS